MAQMECIVCEKTFHRRGYVMKTPLCSKECRRKSKFRKCEQCNAEYTVYGPGDNKKYCSHECYLKTVEDRPKVEHMNPCGYCGRLINKKLRRSKKNVFCSQECNSSYRNPPKTVLCTDCFGRKGDCKCVAFKKSQWGKMINRERVKSRSRFDSHYQRLLDPWERKIQAVMASLRGRGEPGKTGKNKPEECIDWESRIEKANRNARERMRRQMRKEQDPWWVKVQSVESNWRRKTSAREGNKHSTI